MATATHRTKHNVGYVCLYVYALYCLSTSMLFLLFLVENNTLCLKQELSYCKRIARQLRTQYVEGIYRPQYYTVTLKSRLRITQRHWEWNHWIDYTRLTISRVI